MTEVEQSTARNRYRLSSSNRVLLLLVAAGHLVGLFLFSDRSAYQVGNITGNFIGMALFPLLISWVVWLVTGRGKRGGNWTFNIVLVLMILGQVAQFGKAQKKAESLNSMKIQQESFRSQVGKVESGEELVGIAEEHAEVVDSHLKFLESNSAGVEKRFYKIMQEFMESITSAGNEFTKSSDRIVQGEVLQFTIMDTPEEIGTRQGIIADYLRSAAGLRDTIGNAESDLKRRLEDLGPNSEWSKGALEGFRQSSFSNAIQVKLTEIHLEYGKTLQLAYSVLDKRRSAWTLVDGNVEFSDRAMAQELDDVTDKLALIEERMAQVEKEYLESVKRQ